MYQKKMAPHGESSLSQLADGAHYPVVDWKSVDSELRAILAPIHQGLCQDEISTSEASLAFAVSTRSHLEHYVCLKRYNSTITRSGPHKVRSIIKLTNRLAQVKNAARRFFSANPAAFLNHITKLSNAPDSLFCLVALAAKKKHSNRTLGISLNLFVLIPLLPKLPHLMSSHAMTTFLKYFLIKPTHISHFQTGF